MNVIFEKFGITADLFESNEEFKLLGASRRKSTDDELKKAVSYTVPQGSGHSLIRIGGTGDGAYLLPNDLEGIEACFSPGVLNRKDFEDGLCDKYGIKSYMCDFSSDVGKFRTPMREGKQFFDKKWLSSKPAADSITLDDWVNRDAPGSQDLLLQIDIEGAEYSALRAASRETLQRFRIISIEIHALQLLVHHTFLSAVFIPLLSKICADFRCVHTHPNNCCGTWSPGPWIKIPKVLELTFLRKDRVQPNTKSPEIPHSLDVVNVPSKAPIFLGPPWQSTKLSMSGQVAMLQQQLETVEHRLQALQTKTADL